MERYDFEKIPEEFEELQQTKLYKQFIKTACNYSDCICLSFDGGDYEDFLNSKWGYLNECVIRHEYTTQSYVTQGPEVVMLYMKINHITYKWLMEKSGIYDFMDYDKKVKEYLYFYDLCFIKGEYLVFCSCSHEEFCYVSSELKNILINE